MTSPPKTDIRDFGVRAFRSRHHEIRKLKRLHTTSFEGFRVWPSAWLLIDFLEKGGMGKRARVLEVGCGWGLAGIYCAKHYDALVTCLDIDSEVFPYLHLHAATNRVEIATMEMGFDGLTGNELRDFDVLIGSDICFWDTMVPSLKRLILRALGADVSWVVIADPGRSPFEELGAYFTEKGTGDIQGWSVDHPYHIQGRILRVGSPAYSYLQG
ncbi:MAG: methyltransferase domain-containing protein [Proteobacteria bacterium]|nr:methyltransferase domain-containing protein [Pseudomonadota bacterium]